MVCYELTCNPGSIGGAVSLQLKINLYVCLDAWPKCFS